MNFSLASSPARRGKMAKPASDSLMAGWKRSAQGSLPCSLCTISSMRSSPGTPKKFYEPPTTAS